VHCEERAVKTLSTLSILAGILAILLLQSPGLGAEGDADAHWPQFRGPRATGVAPLADPPIMWSESKNVKWKVALPGKGHSSPVVWGDTIFVSTAVATDKKAEGASGGTPGGHRRGPPSAQTDRVHSFEILAVSRKDGSILWQKTAREEHPKERTHPDGSWASNSPVTDGKHVFAYFGSRGLHCFDMSGERKWEKQLGTMNKRMSFGEGSSPALHGSRIVVVQDHEGPSFIVCLDKNTGKEFWRHDRAERSSWSSPLIVKAGGRTQVIVSATQRIRSYDLETGEVIWECAGMTQNVIPMPVYGKGLVFCMSGFRGNSLVAVDLSKARGNVTATETVAWKTKKNTPYTPSPLLLDGLLYYLKLNNAILSCREAKTGQEHYGGERFRDMGTVYASPVGAKDRFYVVGKKGKTLVFSHGPVCMVLAENQLDEVFTATPALVGNEIILRGEKTLYCIAAE